jgi:hypothetical protein
MRALLDFTRFSAIHDGTVDWEGAAVAARWTAVRCCHASQVGQRETLSDRQARDGFVVCFMKATCGVENQDRTLPSPMLAQSCDQVERAARREDRSPVPNERYQAACRVIVAAGTAKRTVRQESHPHPLEDAFQVR